jgi:hypothetical protein
MMSWNDAVRDAAARELGRRHYRLIAVGRHLGVAALGILVLAALAAIGSLAAWMPGHALVPLMLATAAALLIGVAARVAWLLSPRSRARSGSGIGIALAVIAALACVVIAALA